MDIPQSGQVRTLPRRVRPAHGNRQATARPTRKPINRRADDLADAEAERLRAENERYKKAKIDAFNAWDEKLKIAKAGIEEKWAEYYAKVQVSRNNRNTLIEEAEAVCSGAVAPLKLKLRSDVDDLGEEPPDGPRFSKESEIWWTYQHARTALSRVYGNSAGVYEDAKREAVEDARNSHRKSVWKWRNELYAAIKPLKKTAYKIFKKGSEKVDRAEFDLESRV